MDQTVLSLEADDKLELSLEGEIVAAIESLLDQYKDKKAFEFSQKKWESMKRLSIVF